MKKVSFEFPFATSFFISNLAWEVEKKELKDEISKIGVVVDLFVANRKDKHGQRFGFVRINQVQEAGKILEKLNNVKIRGRKMFARISRFERKPLEQEEKVEILSAKAVWNRIGDPSKIPGAKMVWKRLGLKESLVRPNISFAKVVKGTRELEGYGDGRNQKKEMEKMEQDKEREEEDQDKQDAVL